MHDPAGRGEVGRRGIGRLAVAGWIVAALAGGGEAARAQGPALPIAGRVVDERGQPVAAAAVHVYRHDSDWADPDPQVEEVRTGPDGTFRLATPPPPAALVGRRETPTLVLIAEHPGLAVGWKKVSPGTSFRGEIRLTDHPQSHTVAVIDADGRPLPGATVAVNGLGDPEAPSADLREFVVLKPADGPLTATTDAAGLARFANLPPSKASFTAIKPGYARNYRFEKPIPIRLTPAGILEGTLTGPTGEPLGGVGITLHTTSMWEFRFATTDDRGHYRVDDLKPRGWDMAAWGAAQVGDGGYRLWLRSDKFALPTRSIVLEPGERRTLDLRAQPAGLIRVAVIEDGTGRRVPGVRVWGFDREGSRFDAATDAQGAATFASLPTEISLSIASPPEGTFLLENAWGFEGAHTKFDFTWRRWWRRTLILPTDRRPARRRRRPVRRAGGGARRRR